MMTVTLKPHHWRMASTARMVVAFPILPSSILGWGAPAPLSSVVLFIYMYISPLSCGSIN
jgi:hypothetical protein